MAAGLCVLLSLAIKNGDKVCKVLRGKNVMLQATIVGDVQQQVVEIFNICAVARLHGKQEDNAHLFGAGIPVKGLVEQRHRHFGLGAAGAERVGDGEHRVHGGVGERLALKDGGQEGFIGDALVLQHVGESFQHLALSSGLGEAAEKLRVKKAPISDVACFSMPLSMREMVSVSCALRLKSTSTRGSGQFSMGTVVTTNAVSSRSAPSSSQNSRYEMLWAMLMRSPK